MGPAPCPWNGVLGDGAVGRDLADEVALTPNAVAPATAADPTAAAAADPAATDREALIDRILAKEPASTLGAPAPDQSSQQGAITLPLLANPNSNQSSSALTGLAIGAMTLAIGIPLVVVGFAAFAAYQSRLARAASRHKRAE